MRKLRGVLGKKKKSDIREGIKEIKKNYFKIWIECTNHFQCRSNFTNIYKINLSMSLITLQ